MLLTWHHRSIRAVEAGKNRVFQQTMGAVHHIVFNFLNAMQYYKLRAEQSGALDGETLEEYDLVIDKATEKLRELGTISKVETRAIARHMERDFLD